MKSKLLGGKLAIYLHLLKSVLLVISSKTPFSIDNLNAYDTIINSFT